MVDETLTPLDDDEDDVEDHHTWKPVCPQCGKGDCPHLATDPRRAVLCCSNCGLTIRQARTVMENLLQDAYALLLQSGVTGPLPGVDWLLARQRWSNEFHALYVGLDDEDEDGYG